MNLYWWSSISTFMVEIFHPQYHGVKIHLQYPTSKGRKIHHSPAKSGKWLIYAQCTVLSQTLFTYKPA